MTEEKHIRKQVKLEFADDNELPTLFVNTINVRSGIEEFYLTLGTALPLELNDVADLDRVETLEARPYFRFVVTRTVMKQMIDLMEAIYNRQTQLISDQSQEQERED